MTLRVLFLGATGYLGGSILLHLLNSDLAKNRLNILLLSRKKESLDRLREHLTGKVANIQQHDIEYIQMDHSDLRGIAKLSATADIVMNPADSDNLELTNTINVNLSKNNNISKVMKRGKPLHVHISGTALLVDGVNGSRGPKDGEAIYNDLDPHRVWDLPAKALHHEIDLDMLATAKCGSVDTVVVFPPAIHGLGSGMKPLTRQGPTLIRAAYKRRVPGTVGNGLNYWSYVHIDDVSELIVRVTELAIAGKADVNEDGVYFATSKSHSDARSPIQGSQGEILRLGVGELQFKEYVEAMGRHIEHFIPGHMQSFDATPFSKEEEDEYLGQPDGPPVFGGNSLSTSERCKKFGLSAASDRPDVYETLKDEVEAVLKELGAI